MPINGANHKYKSLYEITILTFICLPGSLSVCVRACVCVVLAGGEYRNVWSWKLLVSIFYVTESLQKGIMM